MSTRSLWGRGGANEQVVVEVPRLSEAGHGLSLLGAVPVRPVTPPSGRPEVVEEAMEPSERVRDACAAVELLDYAVHYKDGRPDSGPCPRCVRLAEFEREVRGEDREAADILRRLSVQADAAAEREPWKWKDHACAECNGTMVRDNFKCARHAAAALRASPQGQAGEREGK